MEVFLSWSGERSGRVAEALHTWLPVAFQPAVTWLSHDIDKGVRWEDVITERLDRSDFGIVCLTPENVHSDWMLFEAGALSRKARAARVCTYLYDINESDVSGPLARFQHTKAERADTLRLLLTLNKALGEHALDRDHLARSFAANWPQLERKLRKIGGAAPGTPRRSQQDKLDELLSEVRAMSRTNQWRVQHDVLESIVGALAGDLEGEDGRVPSDFDVRVNRVIDEYLDRRRRPVKAMIKRPPHFKNVANIVCKKHHGSALIETRAGGSGTISACCTEFLKEAKRAAIDARKCEDGMNKAAVIHEDDD